MKIDLTPLMAAGWVFYHNTQYEYCAWNTMNDKKLVWKMKSERIFLWQENDFPTGIEFCSSRRTYYKYCAIHSPR